jgi:hypothetical protein
MEYPTINTESLEKFFQDLKNQANKLTEHIGINDTDKIENSDKEIITDIYSSFAKKINEYISRIRNNNEPDNAIEDEINYIIENIYKIDQGIILRKYISEELMKEYAEKDYRYYNQHRTYRNTVDKVTRFHNRYKYPEDSFEILMDKFSKFIKNRNKLNNRMMEHDSNPRPGNTGGKRKSRRNRKSKKSRKTRRRRRR